MRQKESQAGHVVPVVSEEILTFLEEHISGERCKEHVIQISRFDRIQASKGWLDAASYVQKILEKAGFKNLLLERFPSNGEMKYFTWTPPMGWRGEFGELWMVEPFKKKLADFQEIAASLVKGSRTSEVNAEVLYVGKGEDGKDYARKDVRGKIVLAEGYAGRVHREAVIKRGAAGVVTFLGRKRHLDLPDLVPYQGLWLRKKENSKASFGFTISRRTAELILSLLHRGDKVRFFAKVKGENFDSEVAVMSATISGRKESEEVLLLAHLDHYRPGANDNASGSAAILEIACVLKKLIDEGKLSKPQRTLRFLWTSEWYGMVPWIKKNRGILKKTHAAINFDMVGGDQIKTRSYFYFTKTPDSLPSYINDLIENVTEYVASRPIFSPTGSRNPFHYRAQNFSGGSDHWILCDSTIAVPAVMLAHPDPYHHTAQDSPDHIDPSEMKRVSMIGAAAASFIAWCREEDITHLAHLVFSKGLARIAGELFLIHRKEKAKSVKREKDKKEVEVSPSFAIKKMQHVMNREKEALRSVLRLSDSRRTKDYIRTLIDRSLFLSDYYQKLLTDSFQARGMNIHGFNLEEKSKETETSKIIPLRTSLFTAPLAYGYLKELFGNDEEWKKLKISPESDIGWEICNFANGQRSITEIRDAISAEYHPISIEDIKALFSLLEKASLVSIQKSSKL